MDPKEEIKSRVDIHDLIAEYLQLKQSGAGSFKAICPFHSEKTPSFHVSTEKQIWHCFGCGKGGDCFAFLMEIEGMDFPEALRHLGNKVGVEVTRFSSEKTNEHQRLTGINELAGKFFEKVLTDSPSASAAREYVGKRGISEDLRAKFGLGFAPEGWDTLVAFLQKRGFNGSEIERAGLALRRKSGDGWIDRFRNRVMIPLRNAHGDTVGFTGRAMPGSDDQGPKYMNSPETPIYHKGKLLFGLDLAKRAIKDAGCLIIVEGNLDVVASHKAGVANVVASSGTALTPEQLDLIKRYTKTIVFSFDADAAGFKAARRGIALARAAGFDIRVAVLPPSAGKDPDEAVQKDPSLWSGAVSRTVPIMQYYIDRAITGRDLSNVDDKRAIAALILPELATIQDVVEREHWLQVSADLLRTDIAVLRRDVATRSGATTIRQTSTQPINHSITPKHSKELSAARFLLAFYVQDPTLRIELTETLPQGLIPTGDLASLYNEMRAEYDSLRIEQAPAESYFLRLRDRLGIVASTLVPLLDELSLLGENMVATLPPKEARAQIRQLVDLLTASQTERRAKALEADIRRAESAGDHATVAKLIQEYKGLR
jgi:DNA primase